MSDLMPMCPFCNSERAYVVPSDADFHCMLCGGDFDRDGRPTMYDDDEDNRTLIQRMRADLRELLAYLDTQTHFYEYLTQGQIRDTLDLGTYSGKKSAYYDVQDRVKAILEIVL